MFIGNFATKEECYRAGVEINLKHPQINGVTYGNKNTYRWKQCYSHYNMVGTHASDWWWCKYISASGLKTQEYDTHKQLNDMLKVSPEIHRKHKLHQ